MFEIIHTRFGMNQTCLSSPLGLIEKWTSELHVSTTLNFPVVWCGFLMLWPNHSPSPASSSSSSSSSLALPSSGSFFTVTWLGFAWGPKGLCGSWLEQQGRLSSADTASCPLSCSRQKEAGQKWQKEVAVRWHTLHWCQGHSHRPERKAQKAQHESLRKLLVL